MHQVYGFYAPMIHIAIKGLIFVSGFLLLLYNIFLWSVVLVHQTDISLFLRLSTTNMLGV
jgi:hypothetical protein